MRAPSPRLLVRSAAVSVATGSVLLLSWWLVTRRRPVDGDVVGRMWHRESSPADDGELQRLTVADLGDAEPPHRPDEPEPYLPVVLLHGLGMSSRSMVALLRVLGRHTRTLAPDLPGYGRSPQPRAGMLGLAGLARAVLSWMDEAGLAEVVLVGHSLGAQVAGEVALLAPDRVRRLVVVAPTGDPTRRSVLRLALHLGRDAVHESPSLIALAVRDYLRSGPGQMVSLMRRAIRRAVEQVDVRLQVPLLVVRGEHDTVCRQSWCEDVVRRAPGARLVVVPGAAHGVVTSAPEALVRLLRQELRAAGPVRGGDGRGAG